MPMSFAGEAVRAALALYGIEVSVEQADLIARGAVGAMREPSNVMLRAGAKAGAGDLEETQKVWSAMIAAGMNEPGDCGG